MVCRWSSVCCVLSIVGKGCKEGEGGRGGEEGERGKGIGLRCSSKKESNIKIWGLGYEKSNFLFVLFFFFLS